VLFVLTCTSVTDILGIGGGAVEGGLGSDAMTIKAKENQQLI
jgi:hypothetical protein